VAPRITNTRVNPRINMNECRSTVFSSLRSCASNSSALAPEISDTYPGTSGKTQGDRNEINPAKNAAIGKGSDDIVSFFWTLTLECRFYCKRWKLACGGMFASSSGGSV